MSKINSLIIQKNFIYFCFENKLKMETIVLNKRQIEQKTRRIAHQIIENTFEEKTLFIAGIKGNGVPFAQNVLKIIQALSKQEVLFFEITLDKAHPLNSPVSISIDAKKIAGGTIVLIDDVLNSGKTMQYAVKKLLESPVKSIKTVALIDRKHRRYPIRADYVGLTLSTTLQSHVSVVYSPEPSVFLS